MSSKPQIAPKPKLESVMSGSEKPPLSLLEEIYAEIEDKHAKSSLLKTLTAATTAQTTTDYSNSNSSSSSSNYSSYSSYSSASSSSIEQPPPRLPDVPPPPLSNQVNPLMSLQQEIEREISTKLDTPFNLVQDDQVCAYLYA